MKGRGLERQKLILLNFQSPGDVTMLTALVRDLEMLHPKRFSIGVETQRRDLLENNPLIDRALSRFGNEATDGGRDGEAEFILPTGILRSRFFYASSSSQKPK